MRRQSVVAALESIGFLGAVLFAFAVLFPPFDDSAEVDLSIHMLQHIVIVVAGAMIAYSLMKAGLVRPRPGRVPNAILLVSIGAIVYWHTPSAWDAAVLNPLVHAAEHLTFLLIGSAVGSFLQALSDSVKIAALFAAFFGHMGYAVLLVAPWNIQVYPLFTPADQAILGWALLLTGWVFLLGVVHIVRRNPAWLQGFAGKDATISFKVPAPKPHKLPAWAAPAMSFALVVAMVVYFAYAGVALSGSSPQQGGAVVYIAETPFTWQYSPQSIVVVMGTNNTVTWVSHSTAYDTITSDYGLFDSGSIAPGGSFSFTFETPGTYTYHCLFHPWMTGTVIVLPSR